MNKKKVLFTIIFGILITGVFGLVMAHQYKQGDFPQHIGWAKEYATYGYIYKIPHTLFSKLVVIIRALLPANILVRVSVLAKQVYDLKSYEISAWLLMVFSYLAAGFILVKRFVKDWSDLNLKNGRWLAGLAAFIVLIAGPVFVFTFPSRMYLGYIGFNPYHNPTYILARPFILVAFFGILDNLFSKWDWKNSAIIALMIVCATLAKPNFTVTILPAIALLFLIFHLKDLQKINWWFVIVPLGISAFLVLLSEFIVNYTGDRGEQVLFAPFKSMLVHVPNIASILFRLVMSLVFPLLVSIFYWKDLKGRLSFRLSWINLFVAIIVGYCLAESINYPSNNFWWGAMFGLILLFYETVSSWGRIAIQEIKAKRKFTWKNWVISAALLLHVLCGIVYYLYNLTNTTPLVG